MLHPLLMALSPVQATTHHCDIYQQAALSHTAITLDRTSWELLLFLFLGADPNLLVQSCAAGAGAAEEGREGSCSPDIYGGNNLF